MLFPQRRRRQLHQQPLQPHQVNTARQPRQRPPAITLTPQPKPKQPVSPEKATTFMSSSRRIRRPLPLPLRRKIRRRPRTARTPLQGRRRHPRRRGEKRGRTPPTRMPTGRGRRITRRPRRQRLHRLPLVPRGSAAPGATRSTGPALPSLHQEPRRARSADLIPARDRTRRPTAPGG